jgi:hypothetical protein
VSDQSGKGRPPLRPRGFSLGRRFVEDAEFEAQHQRHTADVAAFRARLRSETQPSRRVQDEPPMVDESLCTCGHRLSHHGGVTGVCANCECDGFVDDG